MRDKIKHAFAVDKPGAAEPTERQREVIDYLCRSIVRRHMTTPAITILEMSRPMNYLFANAMHFAQPAASILARLVRLIAGPPPKGVGPGLAGEGEQARFREADWTPVAEFLEKRGSFDYFCRRIEYFEAEYAKGKASRHRGGSARESGEENRRAGERECGKRTHMEIQDEQDERG